MIIIYYSLFRIIHIKISKYLEISANFVLTPLKGDKPFLTSDPPHFKLKL